MTYYQILGLSPEASESEIKAAYRRLALRYHPDSGSPGDVERFREIQEAYETLSNAERRRSYDRARERKTPVSWTGGFESPLAPFREIFPRAPFEPVHDLEIVLSEAEVLRGGEARVEVRNEHPCDSCHGTGFGFFGWCPTCRGEGVVRLVERIAFKIPRGVESGQMIAARLRDGSMVRARIRVVY